MRYSDSALLSNISDTFGLAFVRGSCAIQSKALTGITNSSLSDSLSDSGADLDSKFFLFSDSALFLLMLFSLSFLSLFTAAIFLEILTLSIFFLLSTISASEIFSLIKFLFSF